MRKNSDQIIEELGHNLATVKRLTRVEWRLLVWLVPCAALLAIGLFIQGLRPDLLAEIHSPNFLLESAAIAALFVGSAYFTLSISVPGNDSGIRAPLFVALLGAIWFAFIVQADWASLRAGESKTLILDVFKWEPCALATVFLGTIPAMILVWLARKAYPTRLGMIGFLIATASSGSVAFGMQFICHDKPPLHFLVFHFGIVFLMGLVGISAGKRILRIS